MAVNRIFGAISQIGGTTGSLDNIPSSFLTENDMAVVKDDTLNGLYFYRYDPLSNTAESVPNVIQPDDTVTGRWLLISPLNFVEDITVDAGYGVITNEIYGNDSGLSIGYQDGTIDVVVGAVNISITKDVTTDSQIVSTLPDGTAPITTVSNTLCDGLNAEFINGNPSTNISLLDDNACK